MAINLNTFTLVNKKSKEGIISIPRTQIKVNTDKLDTPAEISLKKETDKNLKILIINFNIRDLKRIQPKKSENSDMKKEKKVEIVPPAEDVKKVHRKVTRAEVEVEAIIISK